MSELLRRLERELPSFGKVQRKVADYIIREPMEAAFSTINQLANTCQVSTATVIRVATSLGYPKFSDFQRDLREYLRTRSAPPERFALHNVMLAEQAPPSGELFQSISSVILNNIQKTIQGLSLETAGQIVDKIISADHIYVCGSRGSRCFADYLALHLNRMFFKADIVSSDDHMMPERLHQVTEKNLFLVGAMSRYTAFTVEAARAFKQRGATVVAIIDSYDSPIAPYVDHQIIIHRDSFDYHNSTIAMIYIADVLIGMCCAKAETEIQKNLEEMEPLIKQFSITVE